MIIVSAEFVKSVASLKECPAGELSEVALAGRSNAGKSSFLNTMVRRKGLARISGTPGCTRLLNYFIINGSFYFVDLPGYGYARVPESVRAAWGSLVEEYITTRTELKCTVIIMDIRRGPTEMDLQLYNWLKGSNMPVVVVATKSDKLSRSQAACQERLFRTELAMDENSPLVVFSSRTGRGRDQVWDLIMKLI